MPYELARVSKFADLTDKNTGEISPADMGFGYWEKVSEQKLSANATSVSFTGLTGDTNRYYMLMMRLKNVSAVSIVVDIRLNNATTGYNRQYLTASGTTVSAGRDTAVMGYGSSAGGYISIVVFFNVESTLNKGYMGYGWTDTGTTITMNLQMLEWTTAGEVTSIDIVSNTADSLGAGSTFILYKWNAK